MKIRSSLAGVGAALVFALAAQAAEAGATQCPVGEGGGEQQVEVGEGDPSCDAPVSYTPLTATVHSADNVAYIVDAVVENGDELLEPGEVVEVEMDLDDVMAALKANDKDAIMLAAAAGVRPFKAGVIDASYTFGAPAKLTEAEYVAVAKYVYASMQSGRVSGRSDAAGSSTTRGQATAQALGRMWGHVTSFFSSLPRVNLYIENRTFHSNGQPKSHFRMGAEVQRETAE